MTKKWTIFLIILAILIMAGFGYEYVKKINNKKFLSQLKGEVVFVRRDNGVLNIYKINANGTGLKMLYHNEENNGAYLPEWLEEGRKICFATLKGDKVHTFSIDINTGNIFQINAAEQCHRTRTQLSRAEDIIVEKGNVYWKDESGNLHLVYRHWFYNYKLNPGASEASWSPDKKYIIFDVCGLFRRCKIMIADKSGKVAELTKGQQPDWKY